MQRDEVPRWLVNEGADLAAVGGRSGGDHEGKTVFMEALGSASRAFVTELAALVPAEHLTGSVEDPYHNPATMVFWHMGGFYYEEGENTVLGLFARSILTVPYPPHEYTDPDMLALLKLLILKGGQLGEEEFLLTSIGYARRKMKAVFAFLGDDVKLKDCIFLGTFCAGGVHASTAPADTCTTSAVTVSTKSVRTQQPDGSFGEGVEYSCEPRQLVTATPTLRRSTRAVVRRQECWLPLLRGFGLTDARMRIAGFLGVLEPESMARLRAARGFLAAAIASPMREIELQFGY